MRIGEADVLGWMASTAPEVLDFWEQYDAVYPLSTQDEAWIQHGVACSLLSNISTWIAATHGAKLELMPVDSFLPKRLQGKKHQQEQSPEEMQKILEQRFAK